MAEKFIDMHMHTTYSDGELTPDELINLAIIMATKIVENPRTSVELQTRPLES